MTDDSIDTLNIWRQLERRRLYWAYLVESHTMDAWAAPHDGQAPTLTELSLPPFSYKPRFAQGFYEYAISQGWLRAGRWHGVPRIANGEDSQP